MFKKRSVCFFMLIFFYELSKKLVFHSVHFGDFIVIFLKKKEPNLIS